MTETLLAVQDLSKVFHVGTTAVQALRDISLTVQRGECHAIVGESGSGKSTLANLVLGVMAPSSGAMLFRGQALPARRPLALRRAIQLVQQNPLSALNRSRRVGASVRLPLDIHGIGAPAERPARVARLLEEVGLDPALAERRPAALSGGQRQRVAIARALACEPDLLVLDEPTSALDVLVQARVLHLLQAIRARRGLTYLFITHDLAVVRSLADRVTRAGAWPHRGERGGGHGIHPAARPLYTPVAGRDARRLRSGCGRAGAPAPRIGDAHSD